MAPDRTLLHVALETDERSDAMVRIHAYACCACACIRMCGAGEGRPERCDAMVKLLLEHHADPLTD